jgi:hypothetical protein
MNKVKKKKKKKRGGGRVETILDKGVKAKHWNSKVINFI